MIAPVYIRLGVGQGMMAAEVVVIFFKGVVAWELRTVVFILELGTLYQVRILLLSLFLSLDVVVIVRV